MRKGVSFEGFHAIRDTHNGYPYGNGCKLHRDTGKPSRNPDSGCFACPFPDCLRDEYVSKATLEYIKKFSC